MKMKLSKTLLLPIDLVDKKTLNFVQGSMGRYCHAELVSAFKRYKGFTLAEVLITLTILGVVAAITVPSILQNQQQSANKTKVKKAIAVYENALEQMRVVNSLANVDALKNYVNSDTKCTTGKSYFKVVKDGTNDCTFQTGDKVWWNISDISKTIIAVDDKCVDSEPTTDETNACYNKSFYLTVSDSADGKFFVYDDPKGDAIDTLDFVGIAQSRAKYLAKTPDEDLNIADLLEKYSNTPCQSYNETGCLYEDISSLYLDGSHPYYIYMKDGSSYENIHTEGDIIRYDAVNTKDCSEKKYNWYNKATGELFIDSGCSCYAKGTQITLADGSTKNVEDICFDDDLMVWDFDNGCMSSSKAIYIQQPEIAHEYNKLVFSNGAVLKTINQHRIFNKELGKYTYPMTDDTPIGTTTLLDDGTEVTLVSKEVVHEPVEYYNIITNYHFNCFASGISTSCRLNNLYPIKDYKFQKDNREIVAFENFHGITREWYEGLRLGEQPQDINRENAVVFDKSLNDYVTRLIRKNDESKRLALV